MINAIERLIEEQPDRFTGLTTRGSGDVTVYVVDESVIAEEPFTALRREAVATGIELYTAQGLRPRSELTRVMDAITRSGILGTPAFAGAQWGIDPASATVQLRVGEAGVDEVRAAFAELGGAVAITSVPPEEGMTTLGGGHRGPHEGWPAPTLPLDDVVGMRSDAVAQTYRDDGFIIETYQYGYPGMFTSDLAFRRIRLLVRDGVVVDARQG